MIKSVLTGTEAIHQEETNIRAGFLTQVKNLIGDDIKKGVLPFHWQ